MDRFHGFKLLLAPLFLIFIFAAEGFAQTCAGGHVDLKACGAAGDDAADDSPALQAALDALGAAGGGTLSVPEGRYRLASPVSKDFLNVAASVIIRGHGSATVFRFASGPGTTNIRLLGAESLLVENLVFAGTPGKNTDAKIAFRIDGVEKATFRRTDWYGVATAEAGGSVLRAHLSDLLVENSSFRGCGGHFSNFVPVVLVTDWYSTKFADTDFIDYGTLHGVFHSKTPQGVLSWVHLVNPVAEKEGRAVFSRMFLDEGAFIGLFSEADTRAIVSFEHIGMNVNSTDSGVGIKVTGARHASVRHSHFGFASHSPRNAIEFFNVGTAIVEQTELRDKANRILVDNLTKSLTISDSTVETLVAGADNITLRDSNITTLQLAASSRVTTRSGGKLTADGLTLGDGAELATTNQTGTGNLVLSNGPTLASPIFTTPSLGAATGLSLALGGGTPLTTTNRTGTGNLVLANSPTLTGATLAGATLTGPTITNPTITNPTITGLSLASANIGAATATSLSVGGGAALTTTNRTGTGNLVLAASPTITGATLTNPTITGATLTNPTITGASLSGATLVTPNLGAATGLSLALGGGTPLTTTNRTGTGNLVLANAPMLVTPNIGAASGLSLSLGGGAALTTTNQTGTGSLALANSPIFTTPSLGAATGLSLALGGGTPLTTTNRTGTGNLVLADAPTLTGATLASPTITGASLTNATLIAPNLGAAGGVSLALGGGAPLTTTNQTGAGAIVMSNGPTLGGATLTNPIISGATLSNSTISGATLSNATLSNATLSNATLVAPNLGAAQATSLAVGGGEPLTTSAQTGTGSLVLSASPVINSPLLAGRVARTVLQLAPGAAEPSVAGGDVFQVANSAPTAISNFRDGAEGQLLFLVFSDANTTVSDGGPDIRLRGDFSSKPDAVLILLRVGAAWFEISRSVDSKPLLAPKSAPAAVLAPAPENRPEGKPEDKPANRPEKSRPDTKATRRP